MSFIQIAVGEVLTRRTVVSAVLTMTPVLDDVCLPPSVSVSRVRGQANA